MCLLSVLMRSGRALFRERKGSSASASRLPVRDNVSPRKPSPRGDIAIGNSSLAEEGSEPVAKVLQRPLRPNYARCETSGDSLGSAGGGPNICKDSEPHDSTHWQELCVKHRNAIRSVLLDGGRLDNFGSTRHVALLGDRLLSLHHVLHSLEYDPSGKPKSSSW